MATAWLVGMTGALKGRRFEIDRDEITIGRRSENPIPVDDPSVSSHHCSITRSGDQYSVRDLGSTNGTFVNGVAIREKGLGPKDILRAGSIEFMFDGEDVRVDEQVQSATTEIEILEGTAAPPNSFRSASPFGTRRDHRVLWGIAIALIGLLVIAMLVFFLVRFFG